MNNLQKSTQHTTANMTDNRCDEKQLLHEPSRWPKTFTADNNNYFCAARQHSIQRHIQWHIQRHIDGAFDGIFNMETPLSTCKQISFSYITADHFSEWKNFFSSFFHQHSLSFLS